MKCAAAVVLLLALASVASARPVSLRSLLSDKEPIYCTGAEHAKDECPEHYECEALVKKVCGQFKGTYKCWEYACVEAPKYCEVDYAGKDDCEDKYGKELECKKLDKEECVYEKECKYVDTDKCVNYFQEQKCEDKKVCKEYKQEKKCKRGKCTKHDKYNKCTAYGEQDCEYVDTNVCKVYKTVKGDCKYVDTTCKEYKQEEKCDDVKVCWTGKCVEVEKKGYRAGK